MKVSHRAFVAAVGLTAQGEGLFSQIELTQPISDRYSAVWVPDVGLEVGTPVRVTIESVDPASERTLEELLEQAQPLSAEVQG